MNEIPEKHLGAIVSLNGDRPLCYAARDEPVDDADSGWQFRTHKGGGGEPNKAQIWRFDEVLALEPGLRRFIAMPRGTAPEKCLNGEWKFAN